MSEKGVKVVKKKRAHRAKKNKVVAFPKSKKVPESQLIENLQEQYNKIDISAVKSFTDFPLSARTLKGLKKCGYTQPTEIQVQSIGLSLQGKDILGAAKTGSGKTLAFLVPILETLFCKRWTNLDGVGAIVITPTRELAYQIYETLTKIGAFHDFSAGLIIGGKDLKFERKRLHKCNIMICTPGRLLQHMDENPLFDCFTMQILVLDEADRCLDMGFETAMNAIIDNLPPVRQTLLFSATQTKSVKDLARLSLKNPSYVAVHENSKFSTPDGLEQTYTVCELKDKISIVWSFIRTHKTHKCIVFLASCKQVKYVYEIFCRLRPGLSLLALYGGLHQLRRMNIYKSFCSKQHAVLFATDIASRGLDFPAVDWVVQMDCPEDADTYIHRVGRTARYNTGGKSSLLLLSSETAMIEELEKKKIPIVEAVANIEKLQNPVRKMESCLARDINLKNTAQKAFVAYAKSVAVMKDKNIFNVQELDTDSFANSLGLAIPPRIRFLQRQKKKEEAQASIKLIKSKSKDKKVEEEKSSDDEDDAVEESETDADIDDKKVVAMTKAKKTFDFNVSDDSEDDDDGILQVKRRDHDIELPSDNEMDLNSGRSKKPVTRAAIVKKMIKKKIVANKKILFDDEGGAILSGTREKQSEVARNYENANEGGINIDEAKKVLREEDVFDKQRFREKVKAKHREEKKKLKEQKLAEAERDEFGSASDDDDEPDMSWLPDPDKIYGLADNDELEEHNEIAEDTSGAVNGKKRSKRKAIEQPEVEEDALKSKKKKSKLEKINASLSVNEAEELALMLLQKK